MVCVLRSQLQKFAATQATLVLTLLNRTQARSKNIYANRHNLKQKKPPAPAPVVQPRRVFAPRDFSKASASSSSSLPASIAGTAARGHIGGVGGYKTKSVVPALGKGKYRTMGGY